MVKSFFIVLFLLVFSSMSFAQEQDMIPGTEVKSNFPTFDIDFESVKEQSSQEVLSPKKAFSPTIWKEGNNIYVGFNIKNGYYLYKDKINLVSKDKKYSIGGSLSKKATHKNDPFFGDMQVFYDQILIKYPIKKIDDSVKSNINLSVELTYQGCAEKKGICYPAEILSTKAESLKEVPVVYQKQYENLKEKESLFESNQDNENIQIDNSNLIATFLTFFVAGLALTFTPCVLPMLPILSSIVIGTKEKKKGLVRSLSYVFGMSIAYTGLGVFIGLFGSEINLQAKLQSPFVLVPISLVFILLALYLFDLLKFTGNLLNNNVNKIQDKIGTKSYISVFLMGFFSVLIISPCISAPLAGALLYISTTGDSYTGGLALFALSIGMGIPLIAISILGKEIMPKSGPWMNKVKNIFGILLLAMALWLTDHLLPSFVMMIMWSAIIFMIGFSLFPNNRDSMSISNIILSTISLMILVFAIMIFVGGVSGTHNPLKPLDFINKNESEKENIETKFTVLNSLDKLNAEIKKSKKNTFLYFSADWCISCKVMESEVFNKEAVIESMKNFNVIKFNVSESNEETQKAMKKYDIFGPPTFLILDNNGLVLKNNVGEIDAEDFIDFLNKKPGI